MALPTAPLGSLPTMSMPYEIPHYNKGPSIWEQALAQFLVGAAGAAANRGVDNALEKEHAQEFDQTPAGFLSKLTGGATVNDAEAKQMRQNKFEAKQAASGQQFSAGELDRRLVAERDNTDSAARNALELEHMRETNATQRQDEGDSAALNLAMGNRASASSDIRLKDTLDRGNPETVARTGLYGAQAAEHQANAEFYKRILGQPGQTQGAPAAPGASDGNAVRDRLLQERTPNTPVQQRLQDYLASPQGRVDYPTADRVMAGPDAGYVGGGDTTGQVAPQQTVRPVQLPAASPNVQVDLNSPEGQQALRELFARLQGSQVPQ